MNKAIWFIYSFAYSLPLSDCLDLLLDLGGNFDAKRTDGYTCVHGAAAEGQHG